MKQKEDLIKEVIEANMDRIEDDLNTAIGEVLGDNMEEFTQEDLIKAREVFFRG